MKVLLTHRFFWPDTAPYALMLRAIGDALAEAGHEVHVLSTIPSYRQGAASASRRETLGKVQVRRAWVFGNEKFNPLKRVANVLLYCLALFVATLRIRPDIVSASTFPPVIAAWSASLAARLVGARFVYHIQDIHPEVSQISGGRLGHGLPMRLLRGLDNQTLRRADAIVVLAQDMAETLHARGHSDLPIHVVNNFSLDLLGEIEEPPREYRKAPDTRRVIFAGNLGRFQNLPVLVEGITRLFDRHTDLELFFLGDGTALPDLKARYGNSSQVRFAPFLPFSQARVLIAESDIGLVSLSPGIYRVAYPSKILTYVDLGLRVLALVEPHSNLAASITANGWGRVPNSAAPQDIAYTLEVMLQQGTENSVAETPNTASATAFWVELMAQLGAADHNTAVNSADPV